ncbi:GntR family transcriptional regulator [Frigidibacter sp. MR17.14]|uniref:GntR family transcriptional regulator n=1 Tax=Frigidibacter sp. MR17.14 TaxID=3126509 RepID=UPI003013033B
MTEQTDRRLSEEAYDRLTRHILAGALPAGTPIQERPLSEELGLSRTPMRDALLLLEGEGILERDGKRLRVMTMDISRYMENLAIRRLLECEAARLAAGRMDPSELDAMEVELQRLLALHRAGAELGRAEVRRIDERLHSAMAAAAGNAQLGEIVAGLRMKTHLFDLRSLPERFLETCEEHLAILAALRGGDPAAASAAVDRHITAIRAAIIARLLPR